MKRRSLALCVAFVCGTGCGGGGGGATDGPLDSGTFDLAYGMEVGEAHSMGSVQLANHGDKPASVEKVRLVGVRGPVELLGVKTRLFPDDGRNLGALPGFPPPEYPASPLAEKNVVPVPTKLTEGGSPYENLGLVIGVRMKAPGTAAVRGVEVTYTVGDDEYTEFFKHHFWFCSPPAEYFAEGKDCPPKGEADNFGEGMLG